MRSQSITILSAVFLFSFFYADAQILFKPNAAVQQALQKVISDFPNRLQNITGALIQENIESSDYSSTVVFPGTENCTITKYKSEKNKNRSWQAVLPEVENFSTAKKQYRELFLQVKNIALQLPGHTKPVKTTGVYDEPDEQKKFAGSRFSMGNDETVYKNVNVEVALQYTITGWQVSIYVYDKTPDDAMQPEPETKNDY